MWTWVLSLLASKAVPAIKHSLWRALSVVCVLGVVAFLVFTVVRFVNPKPTTTVQAGGVANTYQISPGFGGCVNLRAEDFKKK